ncbi:MAG: histidine kinase [Rhodocyclales bacterium GT-UBC]|nr:MAG: histidine kinase [Rhodocyclales bacterium GT-UBC]
MRHIKLDASSIAHHVKDLSATAAGLLALLPESEKEQLPLLQSACREHGLRLVGAIFPALVVDQAFVTEGAWLMSFETMPARFALANLPADALQAAAQIASLARQGLNVPRAGGAKPTLFMLFDSMVPNIASILDGLYLDLSNRVDYAGVNAGSETFQPMPCLFDENASFGNGVLGLLLPGHTAAVLEHGFVRPERAMCASSTEGNRIASIDWQPAFAVYQQVIKAEYGIELTPENFYQHAVHFPFGIQQANGDVAVRIPVALAEDGSLYCVGEIPENAMLVLLKAPALGESDCIAHLAAKLVAENGAQQGGELLTFYCAGRRMHLGADAEQELLALHAATGVARMAGALSLGEIGSTRRWGYPIFHNATLVCAPWQAK